MTTLRVFAPVLLGILAAAACVPPPPGLPPEKQPGYEPPRAKKGDGDDNGGVVEVASNEPKRKTARPSDLDPAGSEPTEGEPMATPPREPADEKDPLNGQWTMDDAIANMPGTGKLIATISTSMGTMKCSLFADKAPITVANFIGLARGERPFKSHLDGRWIKKPLYDGTTFHRVIKGFMIQGGDPAGNGTGEPGYVIPDEIWPGAKHDRAGQLCMANRGPNTNGAQFFITDAKVEHLDGNYTIFGQCAPTSVVSAIANVPKGNADRPKTKVTIDKVEISREK